MRLTEQQLRFFDTFGFILFPGLFADDVDAITDEFERTWAEHGGDQRDLKRRSYLFPFIDQSEYLSSLIDDSRIEGIASSILGDDFSYLHSDGNYYVGDTYWHSDKYADDNKLTIKMFFYLDHVDRDTGCLRVIPGSHHVGDRFSDGLQVVEPQGEGRSEQSFGVHARDLPALAVENEPGDLLVTNHRTKHSSFGGGNRRRMLAISLGPRYGEDDLAEMRQQIGELATLGEWLEERVYGEKMIRTASAARMRHLEQRLANDADLAGLVRKARLDRLDKLTPHHRIIVNVIKRQSEVSTHTLWEAYQVECQKDSRSPVARRTFTSYVGALIRLKLISGSRIPRKRNMRIFTVV